jgi:hypothetical protein
MRQKMGGTFDWAEASEAEIRSLAEEMFEASGTPQEIRQAYWEWFERMKAALIEAR